MAYYSYVGNMRNRTGKQKDVFKLIETKMSARSIHRSDAKARRMLLALRLAEFRKAMNVDQSSVKGFTQPAISKIESRRDIKLSTPVDYCPSLGAELEIAATSSKKSGGRFIRL